MPAITNNSAIVCKLAPIEDPLRRKVHLAGIKTGYSEVRLTVSSSLMPVLWHETGVMGLHMPEFTCASSISCRVNL